MSYSEKADGFKTVRAGTGAVDVLPGIMATLPAGSHKLQTLTRYVGVTARFTDAGKEIEGQLWGRLRLSGHAVIIPDSQFVLTAQAQKHKADEVGDLGKFISNIEMLDIWMFSEIWPQITVGLGVLDGTCDILITEGILGGLAV